ncbi:MAG TPA: hypothetical protein VHN36_04835 [Ilumatobacteraceae bacterium]|nr:hypothetical protein [Ilumatobacteraceae bacterium]
MSGVDGVENCLEEIVDGEVTWRFDRTFLTSNWTCIWGRGCKGILDEPAEDLNQGCCSIGAELADPDEAMTISALAATLDPDRFQHQSAIDADDVFSDSSRTNTKIVDGACIFLNRPGFSGGEGCALHLAALQAGESPIAWKPSVCWQLPIKVDWELRTDGSELATVRGWERRDWGDEGKSMHWCCTEGPDAYIGEQAVIDSLADEVIAVTGNEVYVELRRRLR